MTSGCLDRLVCNQEVAGSIPVVSTLEFFASKNLQPFTPDALHNIRRCAHQNEPGNNREVSIIIALRRHQDSVSPVSSGPLKMWQRTRIADRAQAITAHELAEHEHGGDHELALIAGPETKLPISHAARELLKQMERGWRGK